MSNVELLKLPKTHENLNDGLRHLLEGLREQTGHMQRHRDKSRGVDLSAFVEPPAEPLPSASLDLVAAALREVGKQHNLLCDMDMIWGA